MRNVFMMLFAFLVLGGFVTASGNDARANGHERLLRDLQGLGGAIIGNEINRHINRQIKKQKKRRLQQTNPYATAEPRIGRAEAYAIQRALNSMGYNVGVPDGIIGSGTRSGIVMYQRSIGATVTGYLTTSQFNTLVSIASVPQPGNSDFSQPRQAGSQFGEDLASGGSESRPLTVNEIRLLQRALNSLGYNAGAVDGKLGRGTGRAVARFLTDRGYDPQTTSPQKAVELSTALAGIEYAPSASEQAFAAANPQNGEISVFDILPEDLNSAEFEGPLNAASGSRRTGLDAFARIEMGVGNWKNREQGVLDLIGMVLAANPSLLEDTELLRLLYEFEGGTFESSYRVEETLAAFRQEVLRRPAPEAARLALVYDGNLKVGAFDRDTGKFKIAYDQLHPEPSRYFEITNYLLGSNQPVAVELLNLPDVSGIDMALEEAERFERNFSEKDYNFTETIIYVTVNSVAYEQATNRYSTDTSLAGVVLRQKFNENRIIHSWPVGAGALAGLISERLSDAVDFADFMGGLRVIQDHVVVARGMDWGPLSSALMLAKMPEAMSEDDTAIAMSKSLLLEDEQRMLWRANPPRENWKVNEFDWRDTADKVRDAFGDALLNRAVEAPFKLVDIRPLDLGRYDLDASVYPLSYNRSKDLRFEFRGETAAIATANLGNTFLPEQLKIPQEFARKLDGVMRAKGGRRMYLGIFATVNDVDVPKRQGRRSDSLHELPVSISVDRIALYADPSLTQLVFDYYGAEGSDLQRLQSRQKSVFEAFAIPPASFETLAIITARLTDDENYLTQLIKTSNDYEQANELAQEDVLFAARAEFSNIPFEEEIWQHGKLTLGVYDSESGSFPITEVRFAEPRGRILRFEGEFKHEIINDLGSVSIGREEAKALLEKYSDREFEFRMRSRPVSVSWADHRFGYPEATIAHEARELYILLGEQRSRDEEKGILSRITYGEENSLPGINEQITADKPADGESLFLTHDLMNALVMSRHDRPLSERSQRWLIANKWLADNDMVSSQTTSFFEPGARQPSRATMPLIGPRFDAWREANRVELPKKLRLSFHNSTHPIYLSSQGITVGIDGDLQAEFCSILKYGYYEDLASTLDLGDLSRFRSRQNDEMYAGSKEQPAVLAPTLMVFADQPLACTSRTGEGLEADFVGDTDGWIPRTMVVFDRLPMPPVTVRADAYVVEVDVAVENLELIANGNDLPHSILKVNFESARYFANNDTGGRDLVLSLTRDDLNPEPVTAADGSDFDVVGVRVGMSLDEADTILRAHFGEPVLLKSGTEITPKTDPFQTGIMYLSASKKERVTVYYENTGEEAEVLAVERVVSAPDWGLPRKAVTQSAHNKYGAPQYTDITDYASELLWGENVVRDNGGGEFFPSECSTTQSQNRIEDWVDEAGISHKVYEYFNWEEARESNMARVPDMDYMFQPETERFRNCGVYLRLYQNSAALSTLLLDLKKYNEAFQQARKRAAGAFTSTGSENTLPEIKL